MMMLGRSCVDYVSLQDLNCAVTLFPDFFVIQELVMRDLIGIGNCTEGLYRMGVVEKEIKALMASFEVWHKRLGHPSNKKLSHLDFIKNVSMNNQAQVCDACFKAKHTRLPFPISTIKTIACLDLIHCDIW